MPTTWQLLMAALAAGLLCPSGAALADTRHYLARCQAPDGSEFVLRAQYEYRHITLGQVSKIHNVQDWEIGYRSSKRPGRASTAPASIRFVAGTPPDCGEVGVVDGVPVVSESFLQSDGTWYLANTIPPGLQLHFGNRNQLPAVRQQLAALNVVALDKFALLVPYRGRLVYERPLFDRSANTNGQAHVGAVLRSVSPDNGVSWSEPVYARDAQLFAIGKPLSEQPYAARLISHNLP